MSDMREAALLVNIKSRKGDAWFNSAEMILKQKGLHLTTSLRCKKENQLSFEVQKAISAGVPLIIVGGGDGTLSSVVKLFIGSKSTLGVLPFGTGNSFARDLGIASNVEAACEVIVHGKAQLVDVGRVGSDYFLNVVTVGLTTQIALQLNHEVKKVWGVLAYLYALIKALAVIKPFEVHLSLPEGEYTFLTLQVVIGNGRFAGPFPIAPDASIVDGKLIIYVLIGTTKWDLLRFALNLPGGHQVDLDCVPVFWTSEGAISTSHPMRVTIDGESNHYTPLHFGIEKAALKVVVPLEFMI